MKDINKLIKAYQKANEAVFEFRKKYGIELFGDEAILYTRTKDDLYKLAELLNEEVKVLGDPNMIAFYTIVYSKSTKFVFVEQQPLTEEKRNEILDAMINSIKEFKKKGETK